MLEMIISQIDDIRERVSDLERIQIVGRFPTLSGGFTNGGVLFTTSGLLNQDATNFIWDNTNKRLGIGTNTPAANIDINRDGADILLRTTTANSYTRLRFLTNVRTYGFITEGSTGSSYPGKFALYDYSVGAGRFVVDASGNIGIGTNSPTALLDVRGASRIHTHQLGDEYFEINTHNTGNRNAYIDFHSDDTYADFSFRIIRSPGANGNTDIAHRGTGQLALVTMEAGNIVFATSNAARAFLNSTGHFLPWSAGTYNLGDASNYWNDVSYKTLTDRGCLGWFDDGVEMQDGKVVKDTEALLLIEKDTKNTVYGIPMLKYSSMPKAVYKPAPIADKDIELPNGKKFKKGEKIGEDGAETTALISILIGAVKELTLRVKELENAGKDKK